MRLYRIGAALGASVSLIFASALVAAEAEARPIVACFSPGKLAQLEGASPQSVLVKDAFESGSCLALRASTDVRSLERAGNGWRFRLGENPKWLHAPGWAAGFASVDRGYDPQRVAGYAGYVSVSGELLERGNALAECQKETKALEAESDVFDKEWAAYWNPFPSPRQPVGMRTVLLVGEKGPRLIEQRKVLGQRWADLAARCDRYESMSVDREFAEFLFGDSLGS